MIMRVQRPQQQIGNGAGLPILRCLHLAQSAGRRFHASCEFGHMGEIDGCHGCELLQFGHVRVHDRGSRSQQMEGGEVDLLTNAKQDPRSFRSFIVRRAERRDQGDLGGLARFRSVPLPLACRRKAHDRSIYGLEPERNADLVVKNRWRRVEKRFKFGMGEKRSQQTERTLPPKVGVRNPLLPRPLHRRDTPTQVVGGPPLLNNRLATRPRQMNTQPDAGRRGRLRVAPAVLPHRRPGEPMRRAGEHHFERLGETRLPGTVATINDREPRPRRKDQRRRRSDPPENPRP